MVLFYEVWSITSKHICAPYNHVNNQNRPLISEILGETLLLVIHVRAKIFI